MTFAYIILSSAARNIVAGGVVFPRTAPGVGWLDGLHMIFTQLRPDHFQCMCWRQFSAQ